MKKLLFFVMILIPVFAHSQGKPNPRNTLSVKDGKDAIYLFLSNRSLDETNPMGIKEVIIYRSVGNQDKFQAIGTLHAAGTKENFLSICGSDALYKIRTMKKLASDDAAWEFIKTHPEIKSYGLLGIDVRFLEAMGVCFVDRESQSIASGTVIYYKAEYINKNDPSHKTTIDGGLVKGTKPAILKPKVSKIIESDSMVSVKWSSSSNRSEDAMFGEVWRKTGNATPFEKAGLTLANIDSVKGIINYSFREKVTPRKQFSYYIVPLTQTMIPGPVSDTAIAISATFNQLPQSSVMSAKDTVLGIYLFWEPLKNTELYIGVVIERRKDKDKRFVPIDTISPSSHGFLDRKVLPNVSYYYQIRWITLRHNLLDPAAFATGMHKSKNSFIEAPVLLSAEPLKTGMKITWKKSPYPDISGYFLYRNDNESNAWVLVSNLQPDTVFVDTTIHDGRKNYKYGVKAVNFENAQSDYSNFIYGKLDILIEPATPLGLRGASDGSRILLQWKDMKVNDRYIRGYNLYRKETGAGESFPNTGLTLAKIRESGFKKINDQLLVSPVYTDNGAQPGTSFCYIVTSVDLFGQEGQGTSVIIKTGATSPVQPPAEIYVRKKGSSIEVSWDKNLVPEVIGYVVYRRAATMKEPEQIEIVSASATTFTDYKVISGVLYFYSVASKSESGAGPRSMEKGVHN
jgi:hypothetical protein